MLYGVEPRLLNQAVARNRKRFPADFMFQLNREELNSLKSQIAMSKRQKSSQFAMSKTGRRGRRTLPYAFTEHGALQAANVLSQLARLPATLTASPPSRALPLARVLNSGTGRGR